MTAIIEILPIYIRFVLYLHFVFLSFEWSINDFKVTNIQTVIMISFIFKFIDPYYIKYVNILFFM